MLAAWLAREQRQRLVVVIAPTPGEAERWLSDLALLTDGAVALYPQREALGEEEPHYEIAGERAETIEALLRGPAPDPGHHRARHRGADPGAGGAGALRLRLAVGERRPPAGVAEALEAMGYRRVPTVTEVAEFSVRGGILDVYGFGMAVPARLEWWGDDISSLRGFDLTTQRSLEELEEITVLPISTGGLGDERREAQGREDAAADPAPVRRTLLELLPPDTLVIEEAAGPDADEVTRAWNEAEHHLEVARRLGEDVPSRERHLCGAGATGAPRLERFPRLLLPATSRRISVRLLPAGAGRSGPQPAAGAARRRAAHARSSATTRASSSGWRSCWRSGGRSSATRRWRSARSTAASSCRRSGC